MPKQDLTSPQGVVDAGQRVFARVEADLKTAYTDTLKLREVWEAGRAAGMIRELDHGKVDADICAAAGKIAEALAVVYALHRVGTDIAVRMGLELAQPASGGPR